MVELENNNATVQVALSLRPCPSRYLMFASIQSTVAITCASVNAGLPPLGGITPPSGPVKPSIACLCSTSLPWAMRAAQWALSSVGAPPAPEVWQPVHRLPKITEPSVVPPYATCEAAAAAAAAVAAACAAAPVAPA